MKTYGVIFADGTKELISIVLDDEGNPRMDTLAPYPKPEDWVEPTIVPFVKIDMPLDGEWEPNLVWFDDRVERQWQPQEGIIAKLESEIDYQTLPQKPE